MKIAYFLSHDIKRNDGVTLKINTQVKEWENLGHTVKVFCQLPIKGDSLLDAVQYSVGHSYIRSRLICNVELVKDIEEFQPDVIYFRYDTFSMTVRKLLKKFKVVTEINTNDVSEFLGLAKSEKSTKSVIRFFAYVLLRGMIFRNVKGIVSVTKELSISNNIKRFNKPSIAVSNSINTSVFNTIKNVNYTNNGVFFIGTPNQPWHGVDFIIQLAYKLPQYDFHIVGLEGDSRDNIHYYGYVKRDDYQEIIKRCCICIGSLAMYRNNMNESNSLKVREYIAGGFPIILGCQDSAYIDLVQPSWMKIIDTRLELDIEDISSFIEQFRDYIIPDSDKWPISSEYNEGKRLDFIKKVISND